MFLFTFNYLGKEHWATCNESCLEERSEVHSRFYEDLASISINNYLEGWKIKKEGVNPLDVKVYKIDKIETDSSKSPIHTTNEIDLTFSKQTVF